MNEPVQSTGAAKAGAETPSPPGALEQLGALASLLVHDLANHLCIISGNATLAQMMFHDPARLESSVNSIVAASGQAGDLLERVGLLRRSMLDAMIPQPMASLLDALRSARTTAAGWELGLPDRLPGESVVPAAWVAFAIQQLAAETGAKVGRLELSVIPFSAGPGDLQRRPNLPPHARLMRIELAYPSSEPFPFTEIRAKHTNLRLLAAVEFIRSVGGKLECHSTQGATQQILLFVPLFHAA